MTRSRDHSKTVTQAEAEAGTSTDGKIWTPERVLQSIAANASSSAEKSWNFPNQLDTHNGTARWYPLRAITITETRANVGIIATNRDIQININKNGTPVITGLTIGQTLFLSAIDTTVINLLTTDYITVDVTQVGSSLPGEDLVVNFTYN